MSMPVRVFIVCGRKGAVLAPIPGSTAGRCTRCNHTIVCSPASVALIGQLKVAAELVCVPCWHALPKHLLAVPPGQVLERERFMRSRAERN